MRISFNLRLRYDEALDCIEKIKELAGIERWESEDEECEHNGGCFIEK